MSVTVHEKMAGIRFHLVERVLLKKATFRKLSHKSAKPQTLQKRSSIIFCYISFSHFEKERLVKVLVLKFYDLIGLLVFAKLPKL